MQKRLLENINTLHEILNQVIVEDIGNDSFNIINHINDIIKENDIKKLVNKVNKLTDNEILLLSKSYHHFLNLLNTAEEHYNISKNESEIKKLSETIRSIETNKLYEVLKNLKIELVLTSHPTEIYRRTIINKMNQIHNELLNLENNINKEIVLNRIKFLVAELWHTPEIKNNKPTPIDEAKLAIDVIKNSLWNGVVDYYKEIKDKFKLYFDFEIDLNYKPVKFSSWTGGDRDGNPYVTANITEKIIKLNYQNAKALYLIDIDILIEQLSITKANSTLKEVTDGSSDPYRFVLRKLREKLRNDELKEQDFKEQLILLYNSLIDCNLSIIANNGLLATITRLNTFGINLLNLDLRQDSSKHILIIDTLTKYYNEPIFSTLTEDKKQIFLNRLLLEKRPYFPKYSWTNDEEIIEYLNTFQLTKKYNNIFNTYIISMCKNVSDILLVKLLLKEFGDKNLPVTPLFETSEDLENSYNVMYTLYNNSWYISNIEDKQMIMIGYSDSSKDVGVLAASIAQYQAQDRLIELSEKNNIKLTLFHGRGGTIARGGDPTRQAIISQPQKSLVHGLRVTEQGEMVRFKYGITELAKRSLLIYTRAIIEANLIIQTQPKQEWIEECEKLKIKSRDIYTKLVKDTKEFADYFNHITPVLEIGELPLGSRPAKRSNGGIESLRAIPWSFAWGQNRMLLPAWLGVAGSLKEVDQATLKEMIENWNFLKTRIDMLDMVFQKTELEIYEIYEHLLLDGQLQLSASIKNAYKHDHDFLRKSNLVQVRKNEMKTQVEIRSKNVSPINILQVECLKRIRENKDNETIKRALFVTIIGVSSGMRNTG